MATLNTLLVNGDSVLGTRNWETSQLYTDIDEAIASADGSAIIDNTNANTVQVSSYLLSSVNTDFLNISTLSWQVRYRVSGAQTNSRTLSLRIVDETTGAILAASQSGGTFMNVAVAVTNTAFVNSSVTAFTYVNTSATKASWDNARIEFANSVTKVHGGDTNGMEIDTVEITGTYTPDNAAPTISPNTADASTLEITPTLEFTGSDSDGNDLEYQVQIDSINDFTSPVIDVNSSDGDEIFTNTVTLNDQNPFTQANKIAFTYCGDLIDSYERANQITNNTLDTTTFGWGQSFKGKGGILHSVSFLLAKSQNPTGNAVAKLFAHSGTFGTSSVRTGTALATSNSFDVSTLGTAYQLINFVFPTEYFLEWDTPYVILLEWEDGTVGGDSLFIGADGVSPTHEGNASNVNSVGTSFSSTSDLVFYVHTKTPILLESNTVTSDISKNIGNGSVTALSQSFTGVGEKLHSAEFLYKGKTGSPTGNAVAKIYAHTGTFGAVGSIPTGSALATSETLDIASFITAVTYHKFVFTTPYTMTAGTKYCIVFEYSGGDGSNYLQMGAVFEETTHEGNLSMWTGSSWINTNGDLNFRLNTIFELPGKTYYWRAKAIDTSLAESSWTTARSFDTPVGSTYTLTANKRSLALSGKVVTFKRGDVLNTQKGSLTLSGKVAALSKFKKLYSSKGSLVLSGKDTLLHEYDVDAMAFIQAVGTLTTAQEIAINNLVLGLKANGTWSKHNAIYPIIGGTASSHKWNLKDPQDTDAAFRITWNLTGIVHDADGVLFDGTTGHYGETHYAPSGNVTLNSESIIFYCNTNNTPSKPDAIEVGAYNSSSQASFLSAKSNTTGTYSIRSRFNSSVILIANSDSRGLFAVSKNGNTTVRLFKDGVSVKTQTIAGALPTSTTHLGKLNLASYTNGFSNQRLAFVALSGGLSDTEMSDDYTVIQAYQQALNRKNPEFYTLASNKGSLALSGKNVNLSKGKRLSSEKGSLALGGKVVELFRSRTLESAKRSLTLSGKAAALILGSSLLSSQGSLALNGKDVNFAKTYVLNSEKGSLALSGKDATLSYVKAYDLSLNKGSLALSGKTVDLKRDRIFSLEKNSLALSGKNANLIRKQTLNLNKGSLVLNGKNASLDYQASDTLLAEKGGLSLGGKTIELYRGKTLQLQKGDLSLGGKTIELYKDSISQLNKGSLNLSGKTLELLKGYNSNSEKRALTLSGKNVDLKRALTLPLEKSSLNLSGKNTDFFRNYAINSEKRSLALSGKDALFDKTLILDSTKTSLSLSGKNINFVYGASKTLISTKGSYLVSGKNVDLFKNSNLNTEKRSLLLGGKNADLSIDYTIPLTKGSLSVNGKDVSLIKDSSFGLNKTSLSLTGKDVSFLQSLVLSSNKESLNLSGKDVSLITGKKLLSNKGSLSVSGKTITLDYDQKLYLGKGSLLLSGKNIDVARTYVLDSNKGSLSIVGRNINFVYGTSKTLISAKGSLLINGKNLSLEQGRVLGLSKTSLSLSTKNINSFNGFVIENSKGSLSLLGKLVSLEQGRVLELSKTSLSINEKDVSLIRTFVLDSAKGSLTLSGKSVAFEGDSVLLSAKGSLTLSGKQSDILKTSILDGRKGSLNISGKDISFNYEKSLDSQKGSISLNGKDTSFSLGKIITFSKESLNISGKDITFVKTYVFPLSKSLLLVSGKDVGLSRADGDFLAPKGSLTIDGKNATLSKGIQPPRTSKKYEVSYLKNEVYNVRFIKGKEYKVNFI